MLEVDRELDSACSVALSVILMPTCFLDKEFHCVSVQHLFSISNPAKANYGICACRMSLDYLSRIDLCHSPVILVYVLVVYKPF